MTDVPAIQSGAAKSVARPAGRSLMLDWVLTLFLVSCIFDPADALLNLKVWLFLAAWGITLSRAVIFNISLPIPSGLLIYTMLFIGIPVLSILNFYLTDGSAEFEGFALLKGYILISLCLLLAVNNIDLVPRLARVLTALSFTILLTYAALQISPGLYEPLSAFGNQTGIVVLDNRDYGGGISMLQVYFVTSPMLAISVAWYCLKFREAQSSRGRYVAAFLVGAHCLAMVVAGTRNNILVAFILPLALWFLLSKRKLLVSSLVSALFAVLVLVFFYQLVAFFDPNENSNSIKLDLLADYGRILSDPWALLFGRGLGAYELWQAKSKYFYVSELTYLEMVRNFGLPLALVMGFMLLQPIKNAFVGRVLSDRFLAIGYAAYLVMCISNPNLFSSMGILILSALLARQFRKPEYPRWTGAGH